MAPTDDDQADERERRVEEIRNGYRRDHSPVARRPQDEPPPTTVSVPSKRRGRASRTAQ